MVTKLTPFVRVIEAKEFEIIFPRVFILYIIAYIMLAE